MPIIPLIIGILIIWQMHKQLTGAHIAFRLTAFLGILGFFGAFVLPSFGKSLWWLELPAIFDTTTIQSSDGRYYSATIPLQRIQRYSANRDFEMGWFVNAKGGTFLTGFTENGDVVSVSARGDQIEIYSPTGFLKQPPIKYDQNHKISFFDPPLKPNEFQAMGLSLIEPRTVANPKLSLWSILLFPFWHPFVAWFLAAAGFIAAFVQKGSKESI